MNPLRLPIPPSRQVLAIIRTALSSASIKKQKMFVRAIFNQLAVKYIKGGIIMSKRHRKTALSAYSPKQ
ncbi:hypothetical protein BZJ20_09105 [Salinivibrio proteolyticus]|nr:hypothetical protein BZJ20_09105 [Salinivibrio proteolyticus]